MPKVLAYHRPSSIDAALTLLGRPAPPTRVLAGGTSLVAEPMDEGFEVVDLQALGLDGISAGGDRVVLGATTRLQDLVDTTAVPQLLRVLARREAPNTIRNQATVGGTIAIADPDSELLAGLLVHETEVSYADHGGTHRISLEGLLAGGIPQASLITEVTLASGGTGVAHRTGRTPMDRPIVSAVGRRTSRGTTRLALTGVAPTPVLVDPSYPTAGLAPTADFRGSSGYRLHLARVLSGRVLEELT
jgi:CO/xanthine dehydrogenase FAD-binding subunit